jgi:hypothetical protein
LATERVNAVVDSLIEYANQPTFGIPDAVASNLANAAPSSHPARQELMFHTLCAIISRDLPTVNIGRGSR